MNSPTIQKAYAQPGLYDLEHAGTEPDIGFFVGLAELWKPLRILETGCGNGRVTLPIARAAAAWGGVVTGLDSAPEMLGAAREKDAFRQVEWIEGNLIRWRAEIPFDLIISPCGSLGHLVELAEQLECWRTAYANLLPGGRFVISEPMAPMATLAESLQSPGRATVELDLDHHANGERLLRYRAVRYEAHQQRISIHYLYDRFGHSDEATRLAGSYQGHVYFPRELQLLALSAGLAVEAVWGDHERRPLQHTDRNIVVVSRRGQ